MTEVLAFRKPRQEDWEFWSFLGHFGRPYHKTKFKREGFYSPMGQCSPGMYKTLDSPTQGHRTR